MAKIAIGKQGHLATFGTRLNEHLMWTRIKAVINRIRLNTTSAIRKIRQGMSIPGDQVAHLRPTVRCTKKWYGSSYGGFYINPDLVNPTSIVYSFGIGKDITFDRKCMAIHDCHVYGFDPTPKAIAYVKSLAPIAKFHFFDHAVSPDVTKHIEFFLPAHPKGVSGSLEHSSAIDEGNSIRVLAKSFSDIANELGHKHIDVVKIDIEGSEYELIDTILKSGIGVDQLLIEFHDRYFPDGVEKSKAAVQKLEAAGYGVFGKSMNYEEVSFIRKALVQGHGR
jgi:FkbM family methyltransferase